MTCGECEYIEKITDMTNIGHDTFCCFRFPPSVFPVQSARGVGFMTASPNVTGDRPACGEFEEVNLVEPPLQLPCDTH